MDGARKDDSGKAPVYAGFLAYFPRAARAVAMVSAAGYEKYGEWNGWRRVPDGRRRYTDAMARHMLNEATGKVYDMVDDMGQPGTRCLEAAMVAWNALARLDKMLEDEPDLLLRMSPEAEPEVAASDPPLCGCSSSIPCWYAEHKAQPPGQLCRRQATDDHLWTGEAVLEANMRKIEARLPYECPDLDQKGDWDVVTNGHKSQCAAFGRSDFGADRD